jgi:hypothetical protein
MGTDNRKMVVIISDNFAIFAKETSGCKTERISNKFGIFFRLVFGKFS